MFYLIYKEENESSFKAIRNFAKSLNIKKIGHTGTLDPFAKGLLLCASDDDTKLIQYIENKTKKYIAKIQFGYETDTLDIEGKITKTTINKFEKNFLVDVEQWFLNQEEQLPPSYSAKKINGVRAYELARNNQQNIVLKPQKIKVFNAKIIEFDYKFQTLIVELHVSNGTYIRSLARDLALNFNTFGFLASLERIEISGLNLSFINDKKFAKINIAPSLKFPIINLDKSDLKDLYNGKTIFYEKLESNKYFITCSDPSYPDYDILGIVNNESGNIKSEKLFGNKVKRILGVEIC